MKVEEDQKAAVGGAQAVQTCPLTAVLTLAVRTGWFNPGEGECYAPGEGIGGVTFKLDGAVATGKKPKTNAQSVSSGVALKVPFSSKLPAVWRTAFTKSRETGVAEISIAGLTDGEHTLDLIPPPGQESASPANAAMTDPGAKKQRFRPVSVKFTLKGCKITEAPVIFDPANPTLAINYAYIGAYLDTGIAIDWKPDWAWGIFQRGARPKPASLIVVHHTSGSIISGAYNTRTDSERPYGAHYEIDLDGHMVKYGVDSQVTYHAAPARWGGVEVVNNFAIGIELVHSSGAFKEAQYKTLLGLLPDLVSTNHIAAHRIIGHSDCDVHPSDHWLMGDSRIDDPGPNLEWTRIEAIGLGMIPNVALPKNQGWAVYFTVYTEALRFHDSDAKKKWGAAVRTGTPPPKPPAAPPSGSKPGSTALANIVKGLQTDLIKMGYSIPRASGTFDNYTVEAVKGFKRHFFTGTRSKLFPGQNSATLGHVDADTAWYIQAVAANIP